MGKLKTGIKLIRVVLKASRISLSQNEVNDAKYVCLTLMDDPYYLKLYHVFSDSLKITGNRKDLLFVNVSCTIDFKNKWSKYLSKNFLTQIFMSSYRTLGRIYTSCLVEDAELLKKAHVDTAESLIRSVHSKKQLLELTFGDIRIGDLIYDTFLRFKPALTVDLQDPFLVEIAINALTSIELAEKTFSQKKIEALITPYCAGYIHWGIWPRIALKKNIPVYVIGNGNQFIKQVRKEFPFHVKDHDLYPDYLIHLPPSQKVLDSIHSDLEARLTGQKIDHAIYYMNSNPFAPQNSNEDEFLSFKDSIVFMLHSFSDCPHVYKGMIFEDFYEWIMQSLDYCKTRGFKASVKAHPADIYKNQILNEINKRFPEVLIIPLKFNNNDLLRMGIKGLVTIHGTVAHEFTYLGLPVICAGDNPHAGFNFSINCKNRDEYFLALEKVSSGKVNTASRSEILKFYYCHNADAFPGRISSACSSYMMKYFSDPKRTCKQDDEFKTLLQETSKAIGELIPFQTNDADIL